jgi:hypothetical protein
MKARIVFQETLSFEVVIDVEPGTSEEVQAKLDETSPHGEPMWFHLVAQQHPEWWKTKCTGVEDRWLVCTPKILTEE